MKPGCSSRPNVAVLRPGRDFTVRNGRPWIFSGAVMAEPSGAAAGEVVMVEDDKGESLGWAAYSPASQIRLRMISLDPQSTIDESFIADLVRRSVERRGELLASGETNAVRLINAENDRLPGVVADCYDGWVICQFTSAFAERWKASVVSTLQDAMPGCRGVAERGDVEVRTKEGLSVTGFSVLSGDAPPELVEICERKVRFLVDVRNGHKTGFYLDQRNARAAVAQLSSGREVLNCFSYTGGFGLAAAAGGAAHVTQVDVSGDALKLAQQNAALNFGEEAAKLIEHVEADVFRYLRTCRDSGRTFDLIVLDPPKFAAAKSQLMKAARGYKDINILAMKLLRPNGILATFSCSGAMTPELFDKVLAEAAVDAHCQLQTITCTRQGEDHPVALTFPEGHYLKGVIMRRAD